VTTWVLPPMGLAEPTPHGFMGWYLFLWGLFTFGMYIGARRKGTKMLKVVFGTLTALFLLLALRDWTGSSFIGVIAGIEGIICGLSAMYLSIAEVLHAHTGKPVLPY
jgi:succinate-acetate transporter protein